MQKYRNHEIILLGDFNSTQKMFNDQICISKIGYMISPNSRCQQRLGKNIVGQLDAIIITIPIMLESALENKLSDHFIITAKCDLIADNTSTFVVSQLKTVEAALKSPPDMALSTL